MHGRHASGDDRGRRLRAVEAETFAELFELLGVGIGGGLPPVAHRLGERPMLLLGDPVSQVSSALRVHTQRMRGAPVGAPLDSAHESVLREVGPSSYLVNLNSALSVTLPYFTSNLRQVFAQSLSVFHTKTYCPLALAVGVANVS